MLTIATRTEAGGKGEDRLVVARSEGRTLVVVADGAGGTGAGAMVAQATCDFVIGRMGTLSGSAEGWAECLRAIDEELFRSGTGGESTAVIVEIHGTSVVGASVGDSGAWLVTPDGIVDLTEHQQRKPLLGSGGAAPVAFGPTPLTGRLLVATDGLFKYSSRRDVALRATGGAMDDAVDVLISGVRLRNGDLQDDVALVLCGETR